MLLFVIPGFFLLCIGAAALVGPSVMQWNRNRRRLHHRLEELRRMRP